MELVQGNEAVVKAAIAVGCRFYAGYPITPSSEIMHLMAKEMPKVGGVFVQMEDEIASISAIIGASLAGVPSMTATSGPGFSLMQEGIGYAAMTETPVVIVNVMRAGPSTGIPTAPSQGDVMQARYGSHGDYPIIVLTPSDVIEAYTFTAKAFHLAEEYKTPVIVLMDELIGHMRESVELPKVKKVVVKRDVLGEGRNLHFTGLANEDGFVVSDPEKYEKIIRRMHEKIEGLEMYRTENLPSKTVIFTYGSTYGVAKAVAKLTGVGIFKVDMLFPFPESGLKEVAKDVEKIVVLEMNVGKIVREVERVVCGECEVVPVTRLAQPVTPDLVLKSLGE